MLLKIIESLKHLAICEFSLARSSLGVRSVLRKVGMVAQSTRTRPYCFDTARSSRVAGTAPAVSWSSRQQSLVTTFM